MNGSRLIETLRDDHETALSRLGSSKALYALTGGEMDAPAVRAAARDEAETAARIFEEWAESEGDGDAADLFSAVADAEVDHRDAVESDEADPDTDRRLYETLDGFETTEERVGGLLARSIVAGRLAGQMVGFFVGSADTSSADAFRGIRDDYDDQLDRAAETLDGVCEDDADWERARAAADAVVDAAYDHYVETLESMGVEPKNVC
ncbi:MULTISPECIES: transcription antitermination protein [Haloprofundus]|uniref:transcription antitermination protein n=1 Tax=Haloprofundus TaxID=1911573 RepID=UPI000E44D70B|nr:MULTISPECIES: transcription antitermination protein [Haloprofundus]QCJ46843.1 transcription antitermination protein [Haloprofundus sp. MHR1]